MKRYGLVGYPLSHSFSQRYFTEKFEREGIADCVYSNFSLSSIGELPAVLADPELRGLNVTIPYKQQVIPFLTAMSPVVESIGACNCIKIQGKERMGHNTDVVGFERSLIKKLDSHHQQALVLGTGGASKAVEWVLDQLGIAYRMVSRSPRPNTGDLEYDDLDAGLVACYTLIVNTTPLGMYPKVDDYPPLPYEGIGSRHYLYDLVYNPERTEFLRRGAARGAMVENGHEMLILQAEESWRIWNS